MQFRCAARVRETVSFDQRELRSTAQRDGPRNLAKRGVQVDEASAVLSDGIVAGDGSSRRTYARVIAAARYVAASIRGENADLAVRIATRVKAVNLLNGRAF